MLDRYPIVGELRDPECIRHYNSCLKNQIFSCGTCLDYYQPKEKLRVGWVTMYNTESSLLSAGKTIASMTEVNRMADEVRPRLTETVHGAG